MPLNRIEQYLGNLRGDGNTIPDKPLNRIEKYLAIMCGEDYETPEPLNRIEQYLKGIIDNGGGGGSAVLIDKTITSNGTYNATDDSADGYNPVHVSVPNSYSAGDEGKVVSSGALVTQTAATDTTNSTYDTTTVSSVTVNVTGGGSPLTLLVNDEVEVSTSSTSETNVKLYDLSFTDNRPNTGYLFLVYDKAGERSGYFNRSYQSCLVGAVGNPRATVYANGSYYALSTNYGVYLSANSAKAFYLCSRYNSTYSGTIDGTYVVKIYSVDLTALM